MTKPRPKRAPSLSNGEMPHPPEKLWRALTQPHLIAEWLMKNDFKPVIGHRFSLRAIRNLAGTASLTVEVLVVEPNKTLSYAWGAGEADLAIQSVVTFIAHAGGRLARICAWSRLGFRPDQKQNYQGAKYGWQHFFGRLEQLLARPE